MPRKKNKPTPSDLPSLIEVSRQLPIHVVLNTPDGRVAFVLAITHEGPTFDPRDYRLLPFLLSPLADRIVSYLASVSAPKKGAVVGRHLGESAKNGDASSTLRVLLAALVERRILAHTVAGYTLSEDFRPVWQSLHQ